MVDGGELERVKEDVYRCVDVVLLAQICAIFGALLGVLSFFFCLGSVTLLGVMFALYLP